LLGWTETEAMGRPAAMIFTPQDRAEGKPEQEMRQAVRDGRAVDERQHIRKDGSRFWASGILTVLSNETGTMRGFAKIMRDNTERRESEAKLHQALQQSEAIRATVESANRAKDEFISTVSHELRTPLNTIRLWSRMLGSGRVPHEDWGEGIRMVDRAALAQQRLIDDLLDVSRMSTGQLRLAMRATRLSEAIKAALQAVQPLAEARNINIESHLSDAVRVVRADPDRIQQVLWNLLANAVKFTPGGGRINVQMERHGGQVEIRVQDNGSGITSEFLPHVFERFRQAEGSTTRRHGGLGLGLAIAKQLIELHGGDIGVSSEGEGRGATFTVRLPLKETTGEAEEDAPAQTGDIRESLGDIRILLVEDDPATRQATCRLLEMHGAAVQTVEAAAAAREAYSIRPPDLLICDIGLPGEDGFALIEQIRSIENDRGLPQVAALALTAFARADDQQRALNAGFNEHLAKPVNTDALVATIRRLAPCD
jgi:PAS domain S-box-containing protein